jgi:hypothetical protein
MTQAVLPMPGYHKLLSPGTLRLLVIGVAAAGLPAIACFGLYTLDHLPDTNAHRDTLVILAYPVLLIGLIFLVSAGFSLQRRRLRLGIATVMILVPLLVLSAIWL